MRITSMKNVDIDKVPRMLKVLSYVHSSYKGERKGDRERQLKKRAFRTHFMSTLPLLLLPAWLILGINKI